MLDRWRPVVQACSLAVVLALPPALVAQDQSPATVKSVEFTGLARTNTAYVQDVVRVRAGDPLDEAVLEEAVRRLLRTGRFLSARYQLVAERDGTRVIFELAERPVVTAIRFQGSTKYRDGELKEHVPVKENQPVDRFAVHEGRDAITAMYREAGYGDVVVTYDGDRLEQTGELVYIIEEGQQVRVRKIEYEGNVTFKPRQLKKNISTRTAYWIFRTGAFDPDAAESDAAALQRYYRNEGFLDARVGYRRELSEDGKDLTLIFTIVEGTRYAIESIQFRGNTAFSTEELLDLMASREGETVKQPLIDSDARAIQTKYWELGYINVTVRTIRVFSDEPGFVQITIEITEGNQYRVGRVVVRGNTRTKDKVVRRALNLYPPDDLLDLNEAREAERRLVETRIFDSARVFPVGDEPDRRDVVMDVQEAERAGDILFGAGVTSNSGLVGTLVLDLKNFDLFDWPRSWGEFFKFRSFFGAGQRFRLELQPGTDVNRYRMDFTEPYFLDRPIRFDVSAYLFERGRDGYNERRAGFAVSFGKRFERGPLQGWTGELALRVEGVNIDDVDLFASSEVRDDQGSNLMTSLKATMVRDRTDNRFIPTSGDRFRISYEQFGILGGDHGFGKLTAAYSWYKTLKTDLLERKSVLHLRGEVGAIVGNAPVFERFFAGGTGSIRGFEFRGVGEHDGIDDTNIGGDFLALFSAEYAFPVYGDNLRGHVFLDTGTVGSGTLRASFGVGVRLTIDVFGPLPLEFNLAFPFSSDSEDDEQIFSFLVGTLF
jgi:outer membrane protein insertion porin family